ncbi:ABC transporter ATP-binding protein [Marinobacterium rhizophilum]|uniref:ABC transporter ATP-binding protein n=1 Tax=Marinobacterium rhizophilum TaxID=420402 RepID=A0ABY5HFE8_9GAMM|nr:ABC transporter ATP-binding protein [Marinobacterium rhizophilum]UTW09995.1 ABC transporter ATP-binding protein [Marinobacterium rhizophilum]
MLSSLKELYSLLTHDQRKGLLRLQCLIGLTAVAEMASIFSIGPFMALVADMSHLQGDGILAQLYRASALGSPEDFLFWLGVGVLGALTVAACVSMYSNWRLAYYGQQLGAELSTRLYRHYMQQCWLFHASGNSSQLINKINGECIRLTNQVITQFLQLNARAILALVIAVAILIYNPLVALMGIGLFAAAYLLLYRIVRRRLVANGQIVTKTNRERMKLMQEGFGGIKDTLLLGRQADFNERYSAANQAFGRAQGTNTVMAQVPRYAMELVAFGAIIMLVLYLLRSNQGDLGTVLPVLAVYALAGFKLLPAFQHIYASAATLRSNLAAFDNLKVDLEASRKAVVDKPAEAQGRKVARKQISLENVRFRYPGKDEWALDNLTLTLPLNQVIGVVGASGSGKSTAIDILLGLIEPDEGSLCIDGQPLRSDELRAWQNNIGYVPQSIFLADASIRENIAFGLPLTGIDDERVERAARMAHLDDLLGRLPLGLNTLVGERGVQLSGGERQRIGIARALYDDADVLVLDEATSALDGITERLVMDAIHDFSGHKTIIIIAHRLSTVKSCNRIYLMDNGVVVDSGVYDELALRNEIFQRMTEHA